MASHEKLYRSQVRPIASRETRRRMRPKSRWCSPRRLCCRSPMGLARKEERALWHGFLAASQVTTAARESKGQYDNGRPHLYTHNYCRPYAGGRQEVRSQLCLKGGQNNDPAEHVYVGPSLALWTLAFAFACRLPSSSPRACQTDFGAYRRVPYTNGYDMVFRQ